MAEQDEPQPAADVDAGLADPVAPYEFLPAHVPFAVETIDRALSGGVDRWTAVLAVSTADTGEELGRVSKVLAGRGEVTAWRSSINSEVSG
ncbi:hypothetical protein GCM10010434_095150 [Winogradskya humida]